MQSKKKFYMFISNLITYSILDYKLNQLNSIHLNVTEAFIDLRRCTFQIPNCYMYRLEIEVVKYHPLYCYIDLYKLE